MFRELFDAAPDAMIAVNHDGHIVRANAQAVRLFGYAESELHGAAIEILIPGHARAGHERHRMGYTANPRVRPMGTGQELTGLKRNGEEFPVEIALSPIHTPQGQMIVASIRDISETQRARQALVRARYDTFVTQIGQLVLAATDLDAIAEQAPELVADALDVAGVAIVFRHAQRRTLQVSAAFGLSDALLDALPSVLSSLDGPKHLLAIDRSFIIEDCADVNAPMDATLLATFGFQSAVLTPLIDGSEPMGMLVALSSVARRFDHDSVYFLRSIANLLGAAMQRIRMEEQLSHAQRLEAVGQLTGGIAHDFNNLLTVISGNLQILESELSDRPQTRDIISSALRAVGRGAELTRKLLAFARRQRLSPSACDPGRLLGDLDTMLKRTLGETIALEIACPDNMPAVFADAGQLEAALVNLAINARDAMPRGGRLSITAETRRHDEASAMGELKPGDYVVFAVRDTGCGMPPEVLARAFEPFFTTKEPGKGSGLGLSMVYGFVKQSGGHLAADSQLGYGTRVEMHLPVMRYAERKNIGTDGTSDCRGNEAILVVEDEPDVRGIAIVFLRSAGYSVFSAENAEVALALLAANRDIALVFSDVVLGSGMTGIELAKEALRRLPGLKVLLTSGYEHFALDEGAAMPSEFELLQKPYTRESLVAAVRESLDYRRVDR
ncbi:MAG: PAS domain S-box protein [Rudaea sp.]|nr:PAS domain S-box protein [Rudaea sp.]